MKLAVKLEQGQDFVNLLVCNIILGQYMIDT